MKTIPSALQTHLNGDLTTVATCWLIARLDGVNLAFTEHDQPITVTIIDSEENIRRLLPVVEEMVDTGLIAISDVQAVRITQPSN